MKRFMKLRDIKIPADYKMPSQARIAEAQKEFREWTRNTRRALPCHITTDSNGVLLHGYAWYCTLQRAGIEEVKVQEVLADESVEREKVMYVFCAHALETSETGDDKEYVWRVTPHTRNVSRLAVGAEVAVTTRTGIQIVRVSHIEKLEFTPRPGRYIKTVVDCAPDPNMLSEV